MTSAELKSRFQVVHIKAKELNQAFEELVGPVSAQSAPGILGVFAYEGQRKLEEFLHRVQDCLAVKMQSADEGLEKVVDQAVADGKLQVIEGGKA